MEWIVIGLGLSGTLFAAYAFSLIPKIKEISRLRQDYKTLIPENISDLPEAGTRVKIKGTVLSLGSPFDCFLSECKAFYSRLFLIPEKRFKKPLEKKRVQQFFVADGASSVLIVPLMGRFIVNRQYTTSQNLQKHKIDVSINGIGVDLTDYSAVEEFLAASAKVTVIGTVKQMPSGEKAVAVDKNKPLVISECSDDAFLLLHFRFYVRLILLFSSMMLTSVIQLYLLFLLR